MVALKNVFPVAHPRATLVRQAVRLPTLLTAPPRGRRCAHPHAIIALPMTSFGVKAHKRVLTLVRPHTHLAPVSVVHLRRNRVNRYHRRVAPIFQLRTA